MKMRQINELHADLASFFKGRVKKKNGKKRSGFFFINEAVGQSAFQGFVNELQGGHMVNKQVTRMKYDQIKTHLTETERSVANTFTGTSSLFRQPGKIEF